jgi:cytochrome c-type biogenesis protein CcmH
MVLLGITGAEEVPGLEDSPAGPVPSATVQKERVHTLTTHLRCPVCQGLNVAESRSEAAVAMQARIRELVSLGYSEEQVIAYFTDRYGDWVLLEPPREGLNWLLWLGPVVLLGGGLLSVGRVLSKRQPPEPSPPTPKDSNPYLAQLLAEVDGEDS